MSSLNAGSVLAFGATGVALGAVALGFDKAVESAANYQQILQQLHANSLLTSSDMGAVDASIKSMSQEGGVGFEALATSFRHAADEGFSLADSQKIVQVAMQASVGTGSDLAETTQELAQALHVMGASGDDASAFMNTLLTASKNANVSFGQFVAGSQQAVAQAAALGVSLADVSAVYATLTRNGQNYALSGTEIIRMMQQIVAPTKAAETELARLSNTTGVNLVSDFTSAGLASRGLVGIFQDLNAAGVQGDEVYRIFGNRMISGRAATVILHDGLADLLSIEKANQDAFSGGATPVQDAFQEALGNTSRQLDIAKQKLAVLGVSIGTDLLPPLTDLITKLGDLATLAGKAYTFTVNFVQKTEGGNILTALLTGGALPGHEDDSQISEWVKGALDQVKTDAESFMNTERSGGALLPKLIDSLFGDPGGVKRSMQPYYDQATNSQHWSPGTGKGVIGDFAAWLMGPSDAVKRSMDPYFDQVQAEAISRMKDIAAQIKSLNLIPVPGSITNPPPPAGGAGTPQTGDYVMSDAEEKKHTELVHEEAMARIADKQLEADAYGRAAKAIESNAAGQVDSIVNEGKEEQATHDKNASNSDAAAKASTSLAKTTDASAATISKDYDEMAKASGTYKDHTVEDWQNIRDSSIQSASQQLQAIQGYQAQINGLQRQSTETMSAEDRKQLDAKIAGLGEKRDAEQKSYDQSIKKANEANTAIESSWKSQLSAWSDVQNTKLQIANLAYDQLVGKNASVNAQLSASDQSILASARDRYANMLQLEEQWQEKLQSDLASGDSAAVQADQNMLTELKTGFVDPAKKEFDDLTAKAKEWANLPTPQMHDLTVQIDEAKTHSDELKKSFDAQNEPLVESKNHWTEIKDQIEQARQPAEQYLQTLQQQATAIQDQITKSHDLLAAQGHTSGTDPALLQLQVQRDQLQIQQQSLQAQGQKTDALDKELSRINAAISAEQSRNQLAQDQNSLANAGLQTEDAKNKLAQDEAKIKLDGSAPELLAANQKIQAATTALGLAKDTQTVQTQGDDFHTKQLQDQLQILNDQKKVVIDMAAASQGASAFGGPAVKPNKIFVPDLLPKPAEVAQQSQAIGNAITSGIAAGVTQGTPAIRNAVHDAASGASAIPDATQQATPVGNAIGDGIATGIVQSMPAIQAAARQAVDSAILAAQAEGLIASPSKRAMKEIGLPLIQGAAMGITSGSSLLSDAMGTAVGAAFGASASPGTASGGSGAGGGGGGGGDSPMFGGHMFNVENMHVDSERRVDQIVGRLSQAQTAAQQERIKALGYPQGLHL
jgi:TP901 family phage tail tape measure protein